MSLLKQIVGFKALKQVSMLHFEIAAGALVPCERTTIGHTSRPFRAYQKLGETLRRSMFALLALSFFASAGIAETVTLPSNPEPEIRIGIIGLDTSHAVEFTKMLNSAQPLPELAGCRVVAAYPNGSAEIESSRSRIPAITEQVRAGGVEIVDSIDELIRRVDAVLIETNDGRPHFDQAIQVLKSGKRTFVDKPMSASLADVIAIFAASRHFKTPVFSSSALRFSSSTKAVRKGAIGDVLASDTYSPCVLELTHPDMSWYGIHGIETLFAVMGTGCRTVSRTCAKEQDVVVGVWSNGRIGTYRGMRVGNAVFGGIAFGTLGNQQIGQFDGYEPLVVEIVRFFRGADPPVRSEETIEMFAFIEAADRSKQQSGAPIEIGPIIESARTEAAKRCNW